MFILFIDIIFHSTCRANLNITTTIKFMDRHITSLNIGLAILTNNFIHNLINYLDQYKLISIFRCYFCKMGISSIVLLLLHMHHTKSNVNKVIKLYFWHSLYKLCSIHFHSIYLFHFSDKLVISVSPNQIFFFYRMLHMHRKPMLLPRQQIRFTVIILLS